MKTKFTRRIYLFLFIFSSLLSVFLPCKTFAQNTEVTIRLINKQSQPVLNATVKVVPVNDSIHYFEKITDSLGIAIFNLVQANRYRVIITSVNYSPVQKEINVKTEHTFFTFISPNVTKTLDAIVIQSKKPLMRQEDDKTIIDPENLAASSTSGYEILEKNTGAFC